MLEEIEKKKTNILLMQGGKELNLACEVLKAILKTSHRSWI